MCPIFVFVLIVVCSSGAVVDIQLYVPKGGPQLVASRAMHEGRHHEWWANRLKDVMGVEGACKAPWVAQHCVFVQGSETCRWSFWMFVHKSKC